MEIEDHKPTLSTSSIQVCEENGLNNLSNTSHEKGVKRKEIIKEVKKQLWLAVPMISVSVLQYSLQMISLTFVGHLGKLPLAGASMAISFASASGFNLLIGMASALETLCGQSYGANQYRMMGIHMQRAMFVLLMVSIPLAVIWANTEPILKAVGQDANIAAKAGQYARFMIPSVFAYGPLKCFAKFLLTQNIVLPMVVFSGITTLLHILLCWALVFKSGLGYRGAALANSISHWINVLWLALYTKFSSSCAETRPGFSKEAFRNIFSFLKLAIPSTFMFCLETWSFELVVLLSGLLPNPELETSVLSIIYNTAAIVWMIPLGLSSSVSTRVSNELGAGRPVAARLAVYVAVAMTISEGILVALVLVLIRNAWGHVYSNDIEVVKYVAIMMPILAASSFLDALQCVLSGNARGCGWQKIGAYVNLGSYYLVGIPLAVVFAFVFHIGGKGLWMGIICALIIQVLSLLAITIKTNWEQEVKKATERVHDSVVPVDSVPRSLASSDQ